MNDDDDDNDNDNDDDQVEAENATAKHHQTQENALKTKSRVVSVLEKENICQEKIQREYCRDALLVVPSRLALIITQQQLFT